MDEKVPDQTTNDAPDDSALHETEQRRKVPLIVFGVTSVMFLIAIAFGTVEARIWRFGRLNFEDRTIRHVWSYFGDRLPDLPAQGFITILYWAALAVMVVGTIVGLWLFLGTSDEDPGSDVHASDVEHPSIHA